MRENSLPYGGKEIATLRAMGRRPADMVLVSLIGPLYEPNPVIVAKPGRTYDWRFMADLSALVVANSKTPKADVRQVLEALKVLPTCYLGMWLADRQNGMNLIVGGIVARPGGLLRYMTSDDRERFVGIGKPKEMTS